MANLITDINLTDQDYRVSNGVIEHNKKAKVTSILRDLQPHREHPSKDRLKRFAAGDLHRDAANSENHDVVEFHYWAVMPLTKLLKAAKVFVLGQVVYLSNGDQSCRSVSKVNPDAYVIFLVHRYNAETNTFSVAGKSGLCKVSTVLLEDVTTHVKQLTDGDIQLVANPDGYEPFHGDMDITSRVQNQTTEGIEVDEDSDDEECSEPYLVEKIVKKQFRNNQYEYLVKWCGYADSENTWELPSNIPDKLLTDFEAKQAQPSMSAP